MKKPYQPLVQLLYIIILLIPTLVACDRVSNQEETIDTVLEWGRLSPFPESAENVTIKTEGSMFTRAFRVTFTASKDEVTQWLSHSPGTQNVTPIPENDTSSKYVIDPGGGAQYAEIVIREVNEQTLSVEIYTYWS